MRLSCRSLKARSQNPGLVAGVEEDGRYGGGGSSNGNWLDDASDASCCLLGAFSGGFNFSIVLLCELWHYCSKFGKRSTELSRQCLFEVGSRLFVNTPEVSGSPRKRDNRDEHTSSHLFPSQPQPQRSSPVTWTECFEVQRDNKYYVNMNGTSLSCSD